MKKVICALLAAVLVCLALPACEEKEPEKLRVCFDTGMPYDLTLNSEINGKSVQEECVEMLLRCLDDADKFIREGVTSEDIELEIIPGDESKNTEREAALQRIRTEIMTGGGPDVFICRADVDYLHRERLFPYVEKSIRDGLFLPLDDLMGRAVLTNFNDLCTPVLEGGKDQNGRQAVIPMAYAINLDIYRREDLPAYDASGKTWEDVLNSDDPVLASQAGWMFDVVEDAVEGSFLVDAHGDELFHIFPRLVDFETGTLAMTEEELAARIKEALASYRRYLEREDTLEKSSRELFLLTSTILGDEELTFVPMRNETGGTTAEVSLYCAINKNTKQPERAFEVIDAFLSEDAQKSKLLEHVVGMPLNRRIMSPELPFPRLENVVFTQQQYEEYKKAIDQIDAVYFPSMLDVHLAGFPESLFRDIQNELLASFDHGEELSSSSPEVFRKGSISDEKLSEIVHTYYEKMERLLDES